MSTSSRWWLGRQGDMLHDESSYLYWCYWVQLALPFVLSLSPIGFCFTIIVIQYVDVFAAVVRTSFVWSQNKWLEKCYSAQSYKVKKKLEVYLVIKYYANLISTMYILCHYYGFLNINHHQYDATLMRWRNRQRRWLAGRWRRRRRSPWVRCRRKPSSSQSPATVDRASSCHQSRSQLPSSRDERWHTWTIDRTACRDRAQAYIVGPVGLLILYLRRKAKRTIMAMYEAIPMHRAVGYLGSIISQPRILYGGTIFPLLLRKYSEYNIMAVWFRLWYYKTPKHSSY